MDWKRVIQDFLDNGWTQSAVCDAADLGSSLVSEIINGHITKMYWDRGDRLLALHSKYFPAIQGEISDQQKEAA